MTAKTLTSGEVQNHFGAVADLVKSGEPVTVTQHGRPTLIIISYREGEEFLRQQAGQRLKKMLDERARTAPEDAKNLTSEEINDLVHELRP